MESLEKSSNSISTAVIIDCQNGPEVKEEYIDDFIEETPVHQVQWSCLEFEDVAGPRRFISFEVGRGDIGDRVESNITGRLEQGILVCNSDMGLTAMDLFNDILTQENDLKNFLTQSDVKQNQVSTSNPGLIIQAYLAFVKRVNGNVYDPISNHVTPINNIGGVGGGMPIDIIGSGFIDGEVNSNLDQNENQKIIDDSFETIENQENSFFDDLGNFSNDDSGDEFLPTLKTNRREPRSNKRRKATNKVPFPSLNADDDDYDGSPPPKTTRKYQRKSKFNKKKTEEEKESAKPLDYDSLIEEIKVACSICMGGEPIDPLPHWEQGKFDKVMSKHMWIKHQKKDFVMIEQEHNQRLLKSRVQVPDKIEVDGAMRIPCHLYPDCKTVFIKALDFHVHRVYHEDLKNHIPIKPDFRQGYSCLHHGCNEIFFDYHELRRHKQQQHPMVELKCRLCDSTFTSRSKRSSHWSLCHRIEENMTCEICGKTYDTRRQLTQHRRIHDESYHVTCDVCGKVFTSQNLLKKHSRWHVRNPEEKCPLCPQKFLYKGAVETHLVRDHGHERRYTCEFCGTQFIHQRHYRRHITKHEKNPDKVYRTQTTRRGYTKKTADYWDEKIILAGNASSKNKAVEQNPGHPHNLNRPIINQSLSGPSVIGGTSTNHKSRHTHLSGQNHGQGELMKNVSASLPVITQSVAHQSTTNTILDAAVRSQIGVRVGDIYDDRQSGQYHRGRSDDEQQISLAMLRQMYSDSAISQLQEL